MSSNHLSATLLAVNGPTGSSRWILWLVVFYQRSSFAAICSSIDFFCKENLHFQTSWRCRNMLILKISFHPEGPYFIMRLTASEASEKPARKLHERDRAAV
jgi:hypothetical protein